MTQKTELTADQLTELTKDQLISEVIALQSHVQQLRNVIKKNQNNEKSQSSSSASEPHPKRARNFNFDYYKVRRVALKLLYFGNNYQGFVVQEDTNNTIEAAIFDALIKTKLIKSRELSNYHRCGRTDKGVSAFSQVISIDLRTNLTDGKGVVTPQYYQKPNNCDDISFHDNQKTEIRYAAILNRVLPPEIRIISWAFVESTFSSRFDCRQRTYKYVFPIGNMNIDDMKMGCKYLIGEHDFRNFCKMDVNNGVTNFKRKIINVELRKIDNELSCDGYSMYEFTVTGEAFLWHQIRCIIAILFLIGEGKEKPEIIEQLLDIQQYPHKPQYCMSAEFPLVLFDCQYDQCDVSEWHYDREVIIDLIRHLQNLWTKEMVKGFMIRLMLNNLQALDSQFECKNNVNCDLRSVKCQCDVICTGVRSKVYKPLHLRPRCESLDERILKANKRKRKSKVLAIK